MNANIYILAYCGFINKSNHTRDFSSCCALDSYTHVISYFRCKRKIDDIDNTGDIYAIE